jgi:hypothetical protein
MTIHQFTIAEKSTQPPKSVRANPPSVHEDDDIAFEGVEMARQSIINGIIVNTH